MKIEHIIAALLCIVVMAHGWHDARALLPLLPYAVWFAAHVIPVSRAALAACAETEAGADD